VSKQVEETLLLSSTKKYGLTNESTNSDKPNDPKLWTIERYRDEVEGVGLGTSFICLVTPGAECLSSLAR
jgi:hypothetical protein